MDIMTTEMQLLRAQDLFVDNEVYCLRWDIGKPADLAIAGAAWIMSGQPVSRAHQLTMQQATSLVLSKLPGYALFLLAGHKVSEPNSRITRYRNRKLWGALTARHLELPRGQDFGEYPVGDNDSQHYFGAIQLEAGTLDAALAIMQAESLSHLVAISMERGAIVADLIRHGWKESPIGPSRDVLKAVCSSEGVLFWPVGAFDDPEAGAVAFATPAILAHILD